MSDGWTSPSTIVGAIAAFAAIAAAAISWMHYKATLFPKGIAGRLSMSRQSCPTGMIRLYVILENESASTWDDIVLQISRPRNAPWSFFTYIQQQARLDEPRDFYTDEASAAFEKRFDELANRGPVRISSTLYEAGAKSFRGNSSTDATSLDLVISRTSIAAVRTFSLTVTLRSNDARPKREVVVIKRKTTELLREADARTRAKCGIPISDR